MTRNTERTGLSGGDRFRLFLLGTAVLAAGTAAALAAGEWGHHLLPAAWVRTFQAAVLVPAGTVFLGTAAAPGLMIRLCLRTAGEILFRVEKTGGGNIPEEGGALLLSNHVKPWDFYVIGKAAGKRRVRFLMLREHSERFWFRLAVGALGFWEISRADSARSVARCLKRARQALDQGELVCMFPEGAATRTGYICRFLQGFEHVVKGSEHPVIPVYVDWVQRGIWEQAASYKPAPLRRSLLQPVTVAFGKPLPSGVKAAEARAAVCELASDAMLRRKRFYEPLPHVLISQGKRLGSKPFCSDSTGRELSYRGFLVASILFADILKERCRDEEMVGIMLPSTTAAAVVNAAVMMAGKIPVNLNFTTSREALASAMKQCGIKTVLTANSFLEKAGLERLDEMCPLEELAEKAITIRRKVAAALKALLLPGRLLKKIYGGPPATDRPATIMFSSGSTGSPKGAVLLHENILANIDAMMHVFPLAEDEVLCGILPFFHAFGFTVTLWLPVVVGVSAAYHPNPVDAKAIGKLVQNRGCSVLISTPTFLRSYIRGCGPDQFGSLRCVIVGAEKLKREVAEAFEEKFGLRPLEGYGVTESSPVVSLNVPHHRSQGVLQRGTLEGSVGRALPGLAVKTIHPDSEEDLPIGSQGVLCLKGGSVMPGYFKDREKTEAAFQDGWYKTGDIAVVNDDGFITIVDRLSRFSKIAGEMVPHLAVENALARILGSDGSTAVVTGIPDPEKGERLAVVHLPFDRPVEEIWEELNRTDLPKLYIPRKDSFVEVEEIPLLGSGKVALRKVREIAAERLLRL